LWLIFHAECVSTAAGIGASATRYSRAEYIRILPVVVTKFKFGNVERHVLGANLVKGADNTALQDRPKTFDGVGANRTSPWAEAPDKKQDSL
jgi:hypothetical protein